LKHPQIHHWLEQIYATQESEPDCQQFQAALPQLVDSEISGEALPETMEVALRAHLKQCPACAQDYAALKQIAELEAGAGLPEVEASLAQFEAESNPERS
jgi:anti-sigma factor RsiW